MLRYLVKRILLILPTFWGITIITFVIIQLAPGDPATLKAQSAMNLGGSGETVSKIIDETRVLYGLDKPIYIQYASWLKRLVIFDFGKSLKDHRPVIDKIFEAIPITLTLNIISILIVYLISVPLGAYCAVNPKGILDRGSSFILFILYALPSFWVAMILIVLFAGGDYLNIFPIIGFLSDGADSLSAPSWVLNVAWHLVLPVSCLVYGSFALLSRFSRGAILEVIRQDYIKVAMAKGLPKWKVLYKHALRNALIPLISLTSTLLPSLIAGSVIIEQIFSIPGMGRLGFESVLARDYPVVMAIAVISSMLTLISILISDLLYALADPRVTLR